jgi:hypothetical protein
VNPQAFVELVSTVTAAIAGKPVDKQLEAFLNDTFPPGGPVFADIVAACKVGVFEGWLCKHEGGGVKYGRIAKPSPATHGYSIDVVDMENLAGPHHVHPLGEVDLIMPLEGDARFDGAPAGWLVYGPGSAHCPTVSQGRAYVLYLLPEGQIEFSKP